MKHSTYLIIGGGLTADAAVKGIREVDSEGSVRLISAEHNPPYKRPFLTKDLWKGKPFEKVWTRTEKHEVDFQLGRMVNRLDLQEKVAVDDRGDYWGFDKLLLATGVRPKRLPLGDDQIIYFRTLEDYQRLRALADEKQRFAVIGGGFIGSEIAASLASNGKEVTMIFPQPSIGHRLFPADLSQFLNDMYRERGVTVLNGQTVSALERHGDELTLSVQGGDSDHRQTVTVDGVVAGVGTEPNVELATAAGLAVSNGIVVDDELHTSLPDVFAAGDVAAFWQPALASRGRVEHEDNAKTMGRFAGRAMAGSAEPYHHLPFFYSDLFDAGYEAVGEIDSRLETVADWKEPFHEGVVYYQRDGRVRGVLLWNVWEQVPAARELIARGEQMRPEKLRGLLAAA
jgi:3-phenylpropionate/trans-cinnamate dioxygenase ferredoxin reductase subunit